MSVHYMYDDFSECKMWISSWQEIKEQLSNLEDLCKKKEKFLQSTKMIVKFRESYIGKLEKAAKSGSAGDIMNDRIVSV